MKLLINLCAHDGIISHYTGVGTIVDKYIRTFNYILDKMIGIEYKLNLITPEYNKDSFGYSNIYDKNHRQIKNSKIIQISNGSNGKVNYGTITDWKNLCKNAKEYIDSINFNDYDLVLTICNDTPFACLNNIVKDTSNHYKIWIPHSTGKIHKVDSAIKDSEKMLDLRIKWEYNAINYINTNNNSYLAGTSQYISKHLIEKYNLDEKKLIPFINGELLSQNTFYEETEEMEKLFKEIENEENIIFAFGRAEEYKNLDACMYLGHKLNIKPVVIAQPYFDGQPIIQVYNSIAEQTNTKLFVNVPFDFPFYILNHFKNNMIMIIPSKKEIFGLIINQVRRLNKNNILIVANDIGGLHEQISDCSDGLLVNLDNIDESTNKIQKYFNQEHLIMFNKKSQQKLNDYYNFEKICFRFLEFFTYNIYLFIKVREVKKMYNILPRHIKELTPISGNRNTFGENVFSIPYNELAFEQKLKVAVDLVRQSMLYCEIPNPQLEMTTLSGDSYTACCILKEYLIQNNLGVHHIICFVEGKKYEIIGMPSTHFILLVSDYNDNWLQLDPSPMVDYKCGQVESYANKWYKTCIPVEDEKEEYLKEIRKSIFQAKFLQSNSAKKAYEMVSEMMYKYNLFSGYYEILCLMTDNLKRSINIEKIRIANKPILEEELENMSTQLGNLQKVNGSLKKQLSLIQSIHRLKIDLGYESENKILINGRNYNVSNLTPRLFYSLKLNTVMIKPSSFFINKDEEFARIMQGEKMIFSSYITNMGDTSKYGIPIMKFFHPDGYKYSNEMNGFSNIFLVNESAENLLSRKRTIRKEYASLYDGKTVKWFNGKEIKWTSLGMNMVHSSDNSCEACCNFQCNFLESQLMTRFMYPNPKLIF